MTTPSGHLQDDNLVGGFVAEEPVEREPLPQPTRRGDDLPMGVDEVLSLCSTTVADFERHDFVDVLYSSFKLAVEPLSHCGSQWDCDSEVVAAMPPSSLAACILLAEGTTEQQQQQGSLFPGDVKEGTAKPPPPAGAGHRPSHRPMTTETTATSIAATSVTIASTEVPIPHHTAADLSFQDTLSILERVKVGIAKSLGMSSNDPLDTDFGTMAVVDFYLELLYLCRALGMTAVQVQQALLLSRDTLADISWMENDAAGDLEDKVVPALHRRLVRLCNEREAAVVETKTMTTIVFEEQIDPVALAQFELAKKEAKGKKAKEMSEATLPRIQVPVTVTKEQRDPKIILKPPYFSTREVLALLDLFKVSLFQHWRLFNIALSGQGREVSLTQFTMAIEDVAISCTPLAEAITEGDHLAKLARNEVLTCYERELGVAFEGWCQGVRSVETIFTPVDAAAREVFFKEVAEDRQEKLDLEQYHRTVGVLKLRVAKKAKDTGDKVCSPAAGAEKARQAFKLEDDWTGGIQARMDIVDKQLTKALQPETAAHVGGKRK